MQITNDYEFLDLVLEMVQATESDDEVAISVAATIGSLINRGYKDLAMEVLLVYRPEEK